MNLYERWVDFYERHKNVRNVLWVVTVGFSGFTLQANTLKWAIRHHSNHEWFAALVTALLVLGLILTLAVPALRSRPLGFVLLAAVVIFGNLGWGHSF
jgi:hypothetical protein